jgi:hypothetical protein
MEIRTRHGQCSLCKPGRGLAGSVSVVPRHVLAQERLHVLVAQSPETLFSYIHGHGALYKGCDAAGDGDVDKVDAELLNLARLLLDRGGARVENVDESAKDEGEEREDSAHDASCSTTHSKFTGTR